MTYAVSLHTNGNGNGNGASHPSQPWLKQTVQQFFTAINWEDHAPEIQNLRLATVRGESQSLSLQLTVNQFLSAIPWDGDTVAVPPKPAIEPVSEAESNAFTLDDFSDLF